MIAHLRHILEFWIWNHTTLFYNFQNTFTMSALEWALIRGSLPSSISSAPSELAEKLVKAEFGAVLKSPEARGVLTSTPGLFDGLPLEIPSSPSQADDAEVRLIVSIALLHAFVQANWTGPDLDFTPRDVLAWSSTAGEIKDADLDAASVPLLTLFGEPAYHLTTSPTLLLLALRLFASLPESLVSKPWWVLRAHLVHLALLDEAVDLPAEAHESLAQLESKLPQDPDTIARYHLERGLLQNALGNDKQANQAFLSAAKASGLEFELSGALGKKTKYQVNALSQLVLLAESRDRGAEDEYASKAVEGEGDGKAVGEEGGEGSKASLPETLALNDDTLLEETEFTKLTSDHPKSTARLSHLDPANQPPLHPLDQSLLLSLCLAQGNNSPTSGLTTSQMMPFISRVVSHPRNWSVHTTALLLRSRLEAGRSRTVERSALQLSALIEQMPTSDSTPAERLRFFHQIPLPSKWDMEKELANRFAMLGVTRSALDIFTRLEMWEDAVGCLQRMEREAEAEKIVRDLLEGRKIESELVTTLAKSSMSDSRRNKLSPAREAKLWCLLGDLALTNDKANVDPEKARDTASEYYEKAWEVSGHTSSRSRRSLGSLYFSRQDYNGAVTCLRDAVQINPLYSRAWFTLGVCLVRLERWSEARDAFRRLVGVAEDDGEGWNNLAAVYLRLDEEGLEPGAPVPPVTYENKLLAWRALKQGLRHAYGNWRMWANYMIVSVDVGELAEAARALDRVVTDRAGIDGVNAVDVDVLDKLVDSVSLDDFEIGKTGTVVPKSSNEGFGLLPIVERLFDHTILTRVNDSPRVWQAHARLLKWKEDWAGALEDYLRAYRCGPAVDPGVETDINKFREGVREIQELVDVLQGLGPRIVREEEGVKKGDWRFQAKGVVRTFIGRTKSS